MMRTVGVVGVRVWYLHTWHGTASSNESKDPYQHQLDCPEDVHGSRARRCEVEQNAHSAPKLGAECTRYHKVCTTRRDYPIGGNGAHGKCREHCGETADTDDDKRLREARCAAHTHKQASTWKHAHGSTRGSTHVHMHTWRHTCTQAKDVSVLANSTIR